MKEIRQEWFGNIKGDLLAGAVVCMTLIPEAIGFSIVAGVDPMIGVYASFCMSLIISINLRIIFEFILNYWYLKRKIL